MAATGEYERRALAADRRIADVLGSRNHLYTLIGRDSSGFRSRIVGTIVDHALLAGDATAFGEQIARPEVAIRR